MASVPSLPFAKTGAAATDLERITDRLEAAALGDWRPIGLDTLSGEADILARSVNRLIQRAKEIVQASERAAMQDSLTGLPNRSFLRQRLDRAVAEQKNKENIALIYIDLDGFKSVNDSLGHAKGDQLLELFSARMKMLVEMMTPRINGQAAQPEKEIKGLPDQIDNQDGSIYFARIGGDEFAVLVTAQDARIHAEWFANRLLRALKEPFLLQGYSFNVGASMGVCCGIKGSAAEYLRQADAAMYSAKAKGRNQYRFYDQTIEDQVKLRFEVATQLRQAFERDEFRLVLQPQCLIDGTDAQNVTGDHVVSAEALLRWIHPEKGTLAPGAFIDIAEEMGLITDIGRWVIKEAAKIIGNLQDLGCERRISINLSPSDLRNEDIVDYIRECLVTTNARPDLLEIEITESVAMSSDSYVQDRINDLRRMGISFAIDDFGTGYSNLSRLSELPIDRLKIDRSLIRDISARADHRTIVQSVINLAHGLKLDVVAEGIETLDQATLLRVLDCDIAQGYLYGKPMWQDDFITLLKTKAVGAQNASDADVKLQETVNY